jgi:putative SOS response-associated peptidase YedK
MCVNFTPSSKTDLAQHFQVKVPESFEWKEEVWQDYAAPIILHTAQHTRQVQLAHYSMIPKHHIPAGVKRFSTMNARAETLAQLRSFAPAWQSGQRCLVPLQNFFEPNYESGKAERWKIGLHDAKDFAVAGLFRTWERNSPDELGYSFTQITINADTHALMRRFHQPNEEKRSLVILHQDQFDDWLSCKNSEQAQTFLQLFPAEQMWAEFAPTTSTRIKQKKSTQPKTNESESSLDQLSLF